MGRGDPLEHPELAAIEGCLDALDLAGAQARIQRLTQDGQHGDALPYFVIRLLFLSGKLDVHGVKKRLGALLNQVGYFPRAALMLHEADTGHLRRPSGPPATSMGAERTALEKPARPSSPSPGRIKRRMEGDRRLAPTEPRGQMGLDPDSPPTSSRLDPLDAQPISDLPIFEAREPPAAHTTPPGLQRFPPIPRGPKVPAFDENRAPPSYQPRRAGSSPGLAPHLSGLPKGAGRYSWRPDNAEEFIAPRHDARARGVEAPQRPTRPDSPRPIAGRTPAASRRSDPNLRAGRSETPSGEVDQPVLPPHFELSLMVDQGNFIRAIATINRAGADVPVEYALLRARAQAGAGYVDDALRALEELLTSPGLTADIRAGAARVLVDLGDIQRGLGHAMEALRANPAGRMPRLAYAQAAVRTVRRHPDEALLVKAERAIESFRGHGGAHAALVDSLAACIHAGLGELDRAKTAAKQALERDPRSIDALAALVEVYGRLGQTVEARTTWEALAELAPAEANALAELLPELSLPRAHAVDRLRTFDPWDPSEAALAVGNRARAIEAAEALAEEQLASIGASDTNRIAAMAAAAQKFLTQGPIARLFAPYDLSLFSIERLEIALDVLYGREPRPRLRSDEGPLRMLLGSYIGEAIRLAHEGHWDLDSGEANRARVVVGDQHWLPYQAVGARIHSGGKPRLVDGLRGALTFRGSDSWKSQMKCPVEAPTPWGPNPWPHTADIGRLGLSLVRSPISVFAEQTGHGALDVSPPSLGGLDAYLELLAPVGAPPNVESAWTRQGAALVGGYVGEVLRNLVGGEWQDNGRGTVAGSFVLVLKGRVEANPVERVMQRLLGSHHEPMTNYVSALARRAEPRPTHRPA
jgi:tetratricopeptide (TPR) repeat protein